MLILGGGGEQYKLSKRSYHRLRFEKELLENRPELLFL